MLNLLMAIPSGPVVALFRREDFVPEGMGAGWRKRRRAPKKSKRRCETFPLRGIVCYDPFIIEGDLVKHETHCEEAEGLVALRDM